jgi:hypothetical protein
MKNAFQNTIAPPDSRLWVTVPPTYLEFLSTTEKFVYDRDTKYVSQMLNTNSLFKSVIEKYGMKCSTVNHGYFVKQFDDKEFLCFLSYRQLSCCLSNIQTL